MRLYAGSSGQFIEDTVQNQITEKMKGEYFAYFRNNPSPAEVSSWRNSLRAVSLVFQSAKLEDHGVVLEYQLLSTSKRLDCMVMGKDGKGDERAVIIELKQWEKCSPADGDNEVISWVGGAKRELLHPSVQVGKYKRYLEEGHEAFYTERNPILLDACSYLHNYSFEKSDVLVDQKFAETLLRFPLFSMDDVPKLKEYLLERMEAGEGLDVLRRFEAGKYRPCKKLMEYVGKTIKEKPQYVLLDEQQVVYDKVFACARKGFHDKAKNVLIVKGGPGTGKSVIAINLMADLLRQEYNAQYATGSRAFTGTLREIIGERGSELFRYFNSYMDAKRNEVDVLICDESHRIRETSNNRFTVKSKRSKDAQIDELLRVAKVAVFLLDDNQVVRPYEIGSSDYIKKAAEKHGCAIHEYELEAQFRCAGSDAFVNWINNTLEIKRTANVLWNGHEGFDFGICQTPEELDRLIRKKVSEGNSARLAAGFCWEWSNPNRDGTLVDDVVVGKFRRPWNAKSDSGKLAPGIPKEMLWAHDPAGIEQVGCIYTAQGFEFDYVGVIFGLDLRYDFDGQKWIGYPDKSYDSVVKRGKDRFADMVKNTYRVLLSRGLKGCYVHFMDKDTERFFRSRMETSRSKS